MTQKKVRDTCEFGPSIHKSHPYHLIHTLSGKTIARAKEPSQFREIISEADAPRLTIHHQEEGWFSPATSIFKKQSKNLK